MTELTRKSGHQTLNGPILEGYSCLLTLPNGSEVMVTSTTKQEAEGVAEFLGVPAKAFHCLVGQPPWYMNQTKEYTLQDCVDQYSAVIAAQYRAKEAQDRLASARLRRRR